VLDPGPGPEAAVGTAELPAVTAGARLTRSWGQLPESQVGFIDNTKYGASELYTRIASILKRDHNVTRFHFGRKWNTSKVAPPELVEEIVASSQFAITGLGD